MSELQKAVADILVKATSAAEAAGKFASEQLPDVAQQYVMYIAVYNGVLVSFGLVIIFGCPILAGWTFRNGDGYSGPTKAQGALIGGLFGVAFGGAFIAASMKSLILAVFAPKILLIQLAAQLVK